MPARQAELRALREARDGRLVGDLDAATAVNQRLSAQLRALQEGNSELEKAAYDAEALRAHIERETASARAPPASPGRSQPWPTADCSAPRSIEKRITLPATVSVRISITAAAPLS